MNKDELNYYSRHLLLSEIGISGQDRLKNTAVLVVGAGGLGCPILQYLGAAGIGKIGVVDGDVVEPSNLHRQILFSYNDLGQNKATTTAKKLRSLNPFIKVFSYDTYLNENNAIDIFSGYDIIIDGTDNFFAKYLTNDIAYKLNTPVVYGSISQFDGQIAVFGNEYKGKSLSGVNLRDLYPSPPPALLAENCAEAGVLGVLPGIVGNIQALETIKLALNMDGFESGILHYFSGKSASLDSFKMSKVEDNPLRVYADFKFDYSKLRGCSVENVDEFSISSLSELNSLDKSKYQVIDVRSIDEHKVLPAGEVCVPLHTLATSENLIDKNRNVLFICKSGVRSKKAAQYAFEEFNIKSKSVRGGVEALLK